MPEDKIAYLPAEDNWWAAGPIGPCGPDTEIFYYMGEGLPPEGSNKGTDSDMWMEIWNNVFMQYNRIDENTLVELPAKCVDTGMGIERCTVTLNKFKSVYDTDLFVPALNKIKELVGENYNEKSARIIADHIRSATHMIADGVVPKNIDQGYILRRLIRRAIREAYKMNLETEFTNEIAKIYIEQFKDIYPSVKENSEKILTELATEENRFAKTLKDGVKEFEKIVRGFDVAFEKTGNRPTQIAGTRAFTLFDTYGFPLEMTIELAKERSLTVDIEGFNKAFEAHQEKSRTAAAGKFKGGLADDSQATIELHSTCHLMLAGLREVLGDHVHQAGSNITTERLRFDFTHGEKMTDEQKKAVEDYVNNAISKGFTTTMTQMPKEEAKAQGVEGSFWEKYPDIVKVYTMTGTDGTIYSRELCGGPHVENAE